MTGALTPIGPLGDGIAVAIQALADQVGLMRQDLAELRRETADTFSAIRAENEQRFVALGVHQRDVQLLQERQEAFQRQTDVHLRGQEDELRDMQRRLDSAEERRRADRRWWASSLVFPVLLVILAALFATHSISLGP